MSTALVSAFYDVNDVVYKVSTFHPKLLSHFQ